MSRIQIKYAELFKLSVEQLFYQNRVCRQYTTTPDVDFLITPTDSCLNVMKRMDLVWKQTPAIDGLIVLGRVLGVNDEGNDRLRFPGSSMDVLRFLMIQTNSETLNFNDLPARPGDDLIYYFTNAVTDAAAPRNHLHITQNASGVNGTDDLIRKVSDNYSYRHTTIVFPNTAKIKHVVSGQTVPPVVISTEAGKSFLTFNLSPLSTGRCQLLINELPVDEFYYLGKYYAEPVFGVIELLLSPALAANYRIIEPDGSLAAQRPFYITRFINRQTFWRYTIQLTTNSPLYLEMAGLTPAEKADFINQLNIESNDAAITFNRVAATDTAFVFVSAHTIFLQEKYISSTSLTNEVLNLALKKYSGDVARVAVVKSYLPYPSTASIDAAASPQIYSDIFLTI